MGVRARNRTLSVVTENGEAVAKAPKLQTPPNLTPASPAPVAPVAVAPVAKPETISDRIRRLQLEARGLAKEHIIALKTAVEDVERIGAEIAAGGEAYPAGVRDVARRLAEDASAKVQIIGSIMGRN